RRVVTASLASTAAAVARGSRYVLCVLKPTRDMSLDWTDLGRALMSLDGGVPLRIPDGDYVVIAGLAGHAPSLAVGDNRPFRRSIALDGLDVQIRMDSWLAADTIRRMGFGHVVAARHHTLIVERGVSFVSIDASGSPLQTMYAANIFAPEPRYL